VVAEDLVQHVVRLAVGGHDDLGAEGRVLIVHIGVRAQPLVGDVPRQGACGQRFALGREALTVRARQGAPAEDLGEGQPLVVAHDRQIRRPERLLPQVPLGGPGQHVVGDAAGLRHAHQAQVRGTGDEDGEQVALELRGAGLLAAGMGEAVQEPGAAVQLDEQGDDRSEGQQLGQLLLQRHGLGRGVLSGQRRDDQLSVLAQSHRSRAHGQHPLEVNQGDVQLSLRLP
jgi:hypothetical protein